MTEDQFKEALTACLISNGITYENCCHDKWMRVSFWLKVNKDQIYSTQAKAEIEEHTPEKPSKIKKTLFSHENPPQISYR